MYDTIAEADQHVGCQSPHRDEVEKELSSVGPATAAT